MLREEAFMHAQGIGGPVELELQLDDEKKTPVHHRDPDDEQS